MARSANSPSPVMNELRAYGLGFPGAHTKSPWPGHLDLAVNGKTFAFMSTDGEPFSITCKLPDSSVAALMFPFASAAAYGLGKSGWVNAKFEPGVTPPADVLSVFKEWILESYRATAPKKLAAALGVTAPVRNGLERTAKKKAAKPTRSVEPAPIKPARAKPARAKPAPTKPVPKKKSVPVAKKKVARKR